MNGSISFAGLSRVTLTILELGLGNDITLVVVYRRNLLTVEVREPWGSTARKRITSSAPVHVSQNKFWDIRR